MFIKTHLCTKGFVFLPRMNSDIFSCTKMFTGL